MNARTVVCQAALTAALMTAAGAASAGVTVGPIEVIYNKIPTSPKSVVPGAIDLNGDPAATNFRAIEDLFLSPDGTKWMLKGRTQLGSDLENIMILGGDTVGDRFLQEGEQVPGAAPGELVEFFGSTVGRWNTLNEFAFSLRPRGANDLQTVLYWNGAFNLEFREGDLYTGLSDSGAAGDETVGNSVGAVHALDNQMVGSMDPTIGNIFSSFRPAATYDRVKFRQPQVDMVFSPFTMSNETLATLINGTFFTACTNNDVWVVEGRIVAPTTVDDVFVVSDEVICQQGSNIPGTMLGYGDTFATDVLSDGTWFARGDDTADNDWAMRNGIVFALTGDAVPGTADTWGAVFGGLTGNRLGDTVLAGNTSADASMNDVIVFYPRAGAARGLTAGVIVREGDPVDIDGNGMFDDDAFIGRGNNTLSAFEPNDVSLSDDGWLYFLASLRDEAGNDLNSNPAFGSPQAFMRVRVFEPADCPADLDGDGQVGSADIAILLGAWGTAGPGDLDGSGVVGSGDVAILLGSWGPC